MSKGIVPLVLGITGGIATGKSTVLRLLGELGACTLSADEVARRILDVGGPAHRQVLDVFGPKVIDLGSGQIDRTALGDLVFRDHEAREKLNSITHPMIIADVQESINRFRKSPPAADAVLAVEIPLLYECELEDTVDEVVVVASEQEAQVSRLMTRNLGREESLRRIRSQMPLADKISRADRVIYNDSDPGFLEAEVMKMWREIRLP